MSGRVGRPRERKGRRGRVAEMLRAARSARSISQEQAARELSVHRTTLALWETDVYDAKIQRGCAEQEFEVSEGIKVTKVSPPAHDSFVVVGR